MRKVKLCKGAYVYPRAKAEHYANLFPNSICVDLRLEAVVHLAKEQRREEIKVFKVGASLMQVQEWLLQQITWPGLQEKCRHQL